MIYSQTAAAHIYIGVAIILAILVTSILGVALSIILSTRSDQHAKNYRAVHPKGKQKPTGASDVAKVHQTRSMRVSGLTAPTP